jgi:hypothetical protein
VSERQDSDPVLLAMLELAVPAWIDRVRPLSWPERKARANACLAIIGYGDNLESIACLTTGVKGGAQAFNAVAEALAIGALQPGGVTWCGLHWEARQ